MKHFEIQIRDEKTIKLNNGKYFYYDTMSFEILKINERQFD